MKKIILAIPFLILLGCGAKYLEDRFDVKFFKEKKCEEEKGSKKNPNIVRFPIKEENKEEDKSIFKWW